MFFSSKDLKANYSFLLQFKKTYGREYTGYAFQVEAESENRFAEIVKILSAIRSRDYGYIANTLYHDLAHGLTNSYYAISFDPQDSSEEKTVFSLYLNKEDQVEGKKSGRFSKNIVRGKRMHVANMAQPSYDYKRVDELYANAVSGIQDAYAYILDAAVYFGGKQENGDYTFTAIHAESPVSEKSRCLFYISGTPLQASQGAKPFKVTIPIM